MTYLRIKRSEFRKGVIRDITRRATNDQGAVCCERCGIWCKSRTDYEIDHAKAEGMQPIGEKRRTLTADDGQLLCRDCHKKKTDSDKGFIAEAKRREANEPLKAQGKTQLQRRFGL